MAASTKFGVNFAQDGTDITDKTLQANHLMSKGVTRFRINIPVYTTENQNPSFRDALTAIALMIKAKKPSAYVVMGYNAFPLNDSNFAAFKAQCRAAAIRLAALGIDEICVGNEEDLNLGFGSQAILRDKIKEVCQAIKVTDGTNIVVSTAITTNVYATWQPDKANWKDFMTLDLHIYGGIAASHFNTYANNVPGELSGANFYCGEYGVDGAEGSGRLAFSNEDAWIRELKRRTALLEANGWPSYYYFAYKLGTGDANNTKWSMNRGGTVGETQLLDSLSNVRQTRTLVGASFRDSHEARPLIKDFGTGLNFPGSAGSISLGTSNPFTGSFYFATWLKWAGLNGGFQTLFAKRDSYAANGMLFSMALDSSAGTLAVDTVTSFVPFAYRFPLAEWTHMMWVHDVAGGRDKLYINGELNSNQGIGTLGTKTDALIMIGANQATSQDWLNGRLNDIVIGTGVPSADDAYNLCIKNIRPGVVWADLPLNEGSGTTALDVSGNGRNGTIAGATYVTDKPRGTRIAVV